VRGVPHLASIATAAAVRGQGLGAAVTAWLTRALLAQHGRVTLGMYADNEVARRMYRALGYRDTHLFSSGRFG
jgi:predicted GNAT family acetyltransferase